MKYDKSQIENSFKRIESTIQKEIENIPEELANTILERALEDTKQMFLENQQGNFKSITYSIYRAYLLGMFLEKAYNKNKVVKKTNNVIEIKAN